MDRELVDRESVVDLQQAIELFDALHSKAGLDADLHGGLSLLRLFEFIEERFEEGFELFRSSKKTGAAPFRDDGAGRTSEVQVDLVPAIVLHEPDAVQELLRLVYEELRHKRNIPVILLHDAALFSVLQREGRVDGNERRIILVDSGKVLVMDVSVYVVCHALHGRKVILHRVTVSS